jgi:2-oxoisovalerate dehydrogenase E1 component beta subunit
MRSFWQEAVRVLADAAGAVGHGGHYHSQSPEAFFTHVPGIKVVVPSSPAETYTLLRAAIEEPDPVVFFEPKMLYRTAVEDVDLDAPLTGDEIGKARVVTEGTDITMVAWGRQVGIQLPTCPP